MDINVDELQRNLQRYQRLLGPFGGVTDRQVRNALKELIAESEERLHAIEGGRVAERPRRSAELSQSQTETTRRPPGWDRGRAPPP